MNFEQREEFWKKKKQREKEKQEEVIKFIDFLMEEYDIAISDLEL